MNLTLRQVLEQNDNAPIYVINKSRGETRGPIIMTAPKSSGSGVDTLRVPDTWLPSDLTEQLPRRQVLDAPDFRASLSRGMIVLVDDLEATELMSKPGAQQERDRVRAVQDKRNGAGAEAMGENASARVSMSPQDTQETASGPQLHRRLEVLLSHLDDQGEISVINSLRNIQDELEKQDIRHVALLADKRGLKKLAKWAKNAG